MSMKNGTVKYAAGKEFPNRFKPGETQQNLVLAMEDGTEEKIYFKTGRMPHAGLKAGDPITIIYEEMNGKAIRKLYAQSSTTSNVTQTQPSVPAYKAKTAASLIKENINAYIYTYKEVESSFNLAGYPDLSEEAVRTITTSILIKMDRVNADLTTLPNVIPTYEEDDDQQEGVAPF